MVDTRFIFNITKILAFIFIFILSRSIVQADVIANSSANSLIADASNTNTSSANNTSNDKSNIESVINCEAKGISTLLFRDEKSHSCIDSSLFTYIGNIITPGLEAYTGILLRLNMRDSRLFSDDNKYKNGQCSKEGRADPQDPRISFAICSNALIIKSTVYNSMQSIWAVMTSSVKGENVTDAVAEQWKFKPEDIYIINKNKKIGDTSTYVDPGFTIPIHNYIIVRDKDKICVAARSPLHALRITDSVINVGCKYIKEPCTGSIYSNFLSSDNSKASNAKCYEIGSGLSGTTETTEHLIDDQKQIVKCANMESCYEDSVTNSQTLLPITGPIVRCLQQMIKRMIGNTELCKEENGQMVQRNDDGNILSKFRDRMRQVVVLVLCVYVIFECIKILLSMGNVKGYNVIIGLLKLILVAYFSIGINVGPDKSRINGIHDWGMDILNGSVISEITNWVLPSADNKRIDNQSRLCQFNRSEYDPNFQDLALWDAIDCRLSHYLGINSVMDFLREQKLRLSGDTGGDPLGVSVPPYYYLLVPALYSGNITLIMMALSYPILVIALAAYMVTSFITCLIGVIILGVLAPIFVPMSLFNYTKNYFDGWAKLIISFILQPMVIMVFIMMSFHVYDYGFYTKCKYNVKQVQEDDNRLRKMFYIDVKSKDLYGMNDADIESNITRCKRSLGWMLNNPVFTIIGSFQGKTVKELSVHEATIQEKFDNIIDDAKIEKDGLVFKTVNLVFQMIRDFIIALFTACVMLYLIQHLSGTISSFIQSLVGGVDTSSMSVQPQQAINLMKAGVNYASGQISQEMQDPSKSTGNKTGNASSGEQNKNDNTTLRGINR